MHRAMSVVLAMGIAWTVLAAVAEEPPAATRPPVSASFPLTRKAAVARALEVSPRLGAAAARLRARDGDVMQAGVYPNPEANVELENFQGNGPYEGFDSLEATYSLSQRIELGGKRSRRIAAAEAGRVAARHGLSAIQLDIVRDVRVAFTEAVAADEAVRLAEERVRLAREFERSAKARVDAGREPTVQLSRAGIVRLQAQTELERSRRWSVVARNQLAALVGLPAAEIKLDTGWFKRLGPLPKAAEVAPLGTPDILRSEAEVARGRAELEVERRLALPDLTVSAGVRRFHDGDDTALVAGASIPIPVFDRNQGAVVRAREGVAAAEAELAAQRLELDTRLTGARARLFSARNAAASLQNKIVPTAEQAFTFASDGYRQGKFSYLEVLDAQGTLADARRDLTDALQVYHDATADLDRLSGTNPALGE